MISAISFTTKDIRLALGGISRSRIHSWAQLPPFMLNETTERSARRFNSIDLLTFAAIFVLEDEYGIKSNQVGRFSLGIHQYFTETGPTGTLELVFIRLRDGLVIPVHQPEEAGFILDITKIRERINIFLGVSSPQGQLPLMIKYGNLSK
ncbi:TPA: hypothetical protein ACGA4X_002993 [Acinetobacter baumannii]|nr:hypothetical protein [Acinetobacter baumannii]MDC4929125.1 hypothetical protein [Acinetobacter baumannii]MDC4967916.1 hypothetical protein [Acinetobacter baumannii]MDO7413358.1 hypothetical protein [Acinetobacter baumannii]